MFVIFGTCVTIKVQKGIGQIFKTPYFVCIVFSPKAKVLNLHLYNTGREDTLKSCNQQMFCVFAGNSLN